MIFAIRKICEVFAKEYRDETKYREFLLKNIDIFKLKETNEDVGSKIKILSDKKFVSNFNVNIGAY